MLVAGVGVSVGAGVGADVGAGVGAGVTGCVIWLLVQLIRWVVTAPHWGGETRTYTMEGRLGGCVEYIPVL